MMHTEKEIRDAAERLERRLEEDRPVEMKSAADLAAIAYAVDAREAAEAMIQKTVENARENGRSWNRIAVALGVSRQAARERFSERAHA
jgi:hypothetical protein